MSAQNGISTRYILIFSPVTSSNIQPNMTKRFIILFMKSSNIRGSSREKLYQELGFESLQQRWWYRKLCLFFKIIKNQFSEYPSKLIPAVYMTRHINSIPLFNVKHGYFKISFFPSTIIEWNNLDSNIKNSESLALLRKRLLTFIKPSANSTFHCHGSNGVKLITRLRLG